MTGSMKSIIFICTSNTCRSPMAEQFASAWLQVHQLTSDYSVLSRGLTDRYEPPGSPASAHGVTVLAEDFSLDLSRHVSALLTEQEAASAVAIVGVTRSHVEQVRRMFPAAAAEGKLHSLAADVPDPWHASMDVYRACAHSMRPLVEDIMATLTKRAS